MGSAGVAMRRAQPLRLRQQVRRAELRFGTEAVLRRIGRSGSEARSTKERRIEAEAAQRVDLHGEGIAELRPDRDGFRKSGIRNRRVYGGDAVRERCASTGARKYGEVGG